MKGVILAGGTGTRLKPYTDATNKHLLPFGGKVMVMHSIEALIKIGVESVMLVTGKSHAGHFVDHLGDGKRVGLKWLAYSVQEEAAGIADALGKASQFAPNEPMVVMLADNIFEFSLAPTAEAFEKQPDRAMIVLARVKHPEHYGVAVFDRKRNLREIKEKPKEFLSHWAVTGVYFYPSDVFSVIPSLKPSQRGELEITDVNNHYLKEGRLNYSMIEGGWWDAGESKSEYHRASNRVLLVGSNK